jgi:glutamyl-tRNA reductase
MSELVCLSVSHETAPVAWRERLAVPAQTQGAAAAALVRAGTAGEALVLATCGRVDTYAVAADGDRAEAALLARLARRAGVTEEALAPCVEALRGTGAARHLMRTAAGLESPVLGEPEILGQLRRAHDRARRAGATGPVLDRLARDALRAGRRTRDETSLAAGAVSVSSIATGLARTLFGDSAGGRALVVGATRTARGLGARLLADGWAVTSLPSVRRGPAMAPVLCSVDVVASATGTRARALPADALIDAAAAHRDRPLLVLDLSVPRDVDPAARDLDGVLLYDVDDLGAAAEHALDARRAGVPAAEGIVEQELHRFEAWRATRSLVPTIKALRAHVRRTAVDSLGDTLRSRHDGGAEVEEALERLVTHLLHAPTRRLRAAAAEGAGDRYAELARDLFGLDEDAVEAHDADRGCDSRGKQSRLSTVRARRPSGP